MEFRYHHIITYILLTHVLILGCREVHINAFELEESTYSIYRALNISETKHIIRIRDLNAVHGDTSSAPLNATVTFTDMKTGTSQVLVDSVIQFPAGATHNYILEMKLSPRNSYQVTVEGPNGKLASTTFTTPGISNAMVLPVFQPIDCVRDIEIRFENVLPSEFIRWKVGFTYQNNLTLFELSQFCEIERYDDRYQRFIVETTPLFMLAKVFPNPRSEFQSCEDTPTPAVSCNDLSTSEVQIQYYHLGPEWNKVFPLYPTDPQDIQAVTNGLGFLGAYYEGTTTFLVD